MIDSDIIGNITETHDTDCTCESCCPSSMSNCQDNRDECEETEQRSGRMKTMKDKLVPIMANCAVIIAVIGLSGSISQSKAIEHTSASRIDAIHRQISPAILDIHRINSIEIQSNRIATTIAPQISPAINGAIAG
jgi:hypothetical protein